MHFKGVILIIDNKFYILQDLTEFISTDFQKVTPKLFFPMAKRKVRTPSNTVFWNNLSYSLSTLHRWSNILDSDTVEKYVKDGGFISRIVDSISVLSCKKKKCCWLDRKIWYKCIRDVYLIFWRSESMLWLWKKFLCA